MGQITGGAATFSRTVKTGEYENKKAEAMLAFTCDDGDYEAVFGEASDAAVVKVHEMLGLRHPAVRAETAPAPQSVLGRASETRTATETAVVEKPRRGRPPKDKPVAETADLKAGEDVVMAALNDPAPADAASVEEWDAAPAPVVTDGDLQSACAATNARTQNPTAIRALIAKYAGAAPKTVRDVPEGARSRFMTELAAIPSAA